MGWVRAVGSAAGRPRTWQALVAWLLFLGVVWLTTLVLSSTAEAQPDQRGASVEDPATRGETIWRRDCASCHGPEGDGTAWGPDLQGKGPAAVHLAVKSGRMPIEDLSQLREPAPGEDARQVPRQHGGATRYLPGQITALVEYSREILRGPDVPVVDVAGADASHGGELFQRNCASCHAWSARGGALTNGHVAPSLTGSSPEEVVAAMRTGLGTMPEFPSAVLSDEEAADIAAYVEYLKHPRDAGGQPLAYIGPAAEGLAAGVIGILGLLLLVRWIGSRS